jgi:glycosyltransferase involved in cell wall biosynthesis
VHFVVPDGIEDPARPSGGNVYDSKLRRELIASGRPVDEHPVPGAWPRPGAESLAALDRVLRRIPDGATVLLDGLLASPAPDVLTPQAGRLRLVVLVHMPVGHRPLDRTREARRREGATLAAAAAVIVTSDWTRRRLVELYGLGAERIHVAEPAVDAAGLATGTAAGGALLCVAAVCLDKGHDLLLEALASIEELPWRCVCAGSLERDPAFAEHLRGALGAGLGDRVSFPGPLAGADLDRAYAAADAVVLASRSETYGMVVIEALARGLPVIAADVGGVAEALGRDRAGDRPGLLVPANDPAALGAALRAWLGDAGLRGRLRRAARERRGALPRWAETAAAIAGVLSTVSR